MPKSDNTKGRNQNAAQPLGELTGTASKSDVKRAGEASRRKAGPDGGDSAAVGKTFKKKPS